MVENGAGPSGPSSSSAPARSEASSVDQRGTAAVLRVLLVEDEQFQRDAFEALFASANRRLGGKLLFSVKLVSCASEVMEAIQETTNWQLVLLDINMPGISGSEIITDVRRPCNLTLHSLETEPKTQSRPWPRPPKTSASAVNPTADMFSCRHVT